MISSDPTDITFRPFVIGEALRCMNAAESKPEDLPGRYGRTIADLKRLLQAIDALSVVAGGWAVWHHGYAGRVTEDVDIVVSQDAIDDLQRHATNFGFDFLPPPKGRWPKLFHRETRIDVDLLPEGGIPGTVSNRAPVAIRSPQSYGASWRSLPYISMAGLVELKLGAGRAKDIADLIEIIKMHPDRIQELQEHVTEIHASYGAKFVQLVQQAREEG